MRDLFLNKVTNIDCVEGMERLPDNSIDLTVTSPPYDNLRDYDGYNFDYKKKLLNSYTV
ncbi:site-specific DNA-methyltransferase [Staphylococcus pseudintermedius]|uniref:site-specific DNA-methyltransferase n=1 Tax=Staphylococcus pseudintermedius TaxID=283734 RepID=UPI00193312C1|nr:site-specific DNA-methyltransferase [Staphylococcus pseudintermedius]